MAKSQLFLAGAAIALAVASPAIADPLAANWTAPYIELGGGLSSFTPTLNDLTNNNTNGGGPYLSTITSQTHGPGLTFRGAIGAEILPSTRGEIGFNLTHGSGRFNVQAEGSGTIGVDATTFAALVNLWRDFEVTNNVSVHVGGGLGAGVITASVNPGDGGPYTHAGVAYMAGVGTTVGLGPNGTALTIDYRVNGVTGANSIGTASVDTFWETISGTIGTTLDQSITVGIRIPIH